MSRHSKWAKIKHGKGAADQKRAATFTKLSRAITIAAREGGDPATNFKLRLTMDLARAAAMPKDTIERAIAKGTGTAEKEGAQLFEETYEGFGPGGAAFMVEVVTDNKNRAYQAVRKLFSDHGGNLGSPGSVAWMFIRRGVIRLPSQSSLLMGEERRGWEDLELKLIDAGAEDIVAEDEGSTVYTKPEELKSVEEKIRTLQLVPDYAGLEWVPKEKITLPEETRAKLEKFAEALDELEDVGNYYTNAS